MAASWDEIKRLAADFQRAQLSSTTQKLSERNCHEIVNKLITLGLLNVIYTSDGKTYLTPEELEKEIREEIDLAGGRINLIDVQAALHVDITHIDKKVHQMLTSDTDLQLILGQVIHTSYMDSLCRDVNDTLQSKGQVLFSALTREYNLPGDFLKKEVGSRLGVYIFGQVDPANSDVLYTEAYINRHRSIIRGLLSAVTRPSPVSTLLNRYNIPERLFYTLVDELITSSRLRGSLISNKSIFLPECYSRAQNDWINNFYTQNGYIEYANLTRLGVSDAKTWVRKHYPNSIQLNSCALNEATLEALKVAIEESVNSDTWTDAMTHLPSVVTRTDAANLVNKCVRSHKQAVVLNETIVTTRDFVQSFLPTFESIMYETAEKNVKQIANAFSESAGRSAASIDPDISRKDERKKKATNIQKTGGGTQGREVKMKSTKNKYKGRGKHDDSDEEQEMVTPISHKPQLVEFMSESKIDEILSKQRSLEDCPAALLSEISSRIYRPLRDKYQTVAREVYERSVSATTDADGTSSGKSRKQLQTENEELINSLYSNIKLFEKSIKLFPEDSDVQSGLYKYLLKTVCTELLNVVIKTLSVEHMVTFTDERLATTEGRAKIISDLPDGIKQTVTKVHQTLTGKSVEAFDSAFEELMSPKNVGILLKKSDKKKDRQLVFNHKHSLIDQLNNSPQDAASSFHLSLVILFNSIHQSMLHCPGKLLPQVLMQLKPHLSDEHFAMLCRCQDLIMYQVKGDVEQTDGELSSSVEQCRNIAITVKKSITKSAE